MRGLLSAVGKSLLCLSHSISNWPGTHDEAQAGLRPAAVFLLQSPVLGRRHATAQTAGLLSSSFSIPFLDSLSRFPFSIPLLDSPSQFLFSIPLLDSPSRFPFSVPLLGSSPQFLLLLPLLPSLIPTYSSIGRVLPYYFSWCCDQILGTTQLRGRRASCGSLSEEVRFTVEGMHGGSVVAGACSYDSSPPHLFLCQPFPFSYRKTFVLENRTNHFLTWE